MRLDVTMYVIATIFLVLALISFILFPETELLWLLNIALGITTMLIGYGLRPTQKQTIKKTSTTPTTTSTNPNETTTITQPTSTEEIPLVEKPAADNAPAEEIKTTEEPVLMETPPTTEETPPTTEETPSTESTSDENVQSIEATTETTETATETSTTPQEETTPTTTQNTEEVEEATDVEEAEEKIDAEEEISLTDVKGIGEKRAAQLNALGINTAKELSQASAEDLAEKLKISPKVAAKLIDAAKQQ